MTLWPLGPSVGDMTMSHDYMIIIIIIIIIFEVGAVWPLWPLWHLHDLLGQTVDNSVGTYTSHSD